ncbi:MAG: response regulator [Magnetococcales bacterium]|nr:response regulator [Magnetococcales bacterium]
MRTKLRWMALLPVLVFLMLSVHALVVNRQVAQVMEIAKQMNQVVKLSAQLVTTTYEVVAYERERPDVQWHRLQERLGQELNLLNEQVVDGDPHYLLEEMRARLENAKFHHDELHATAHLVAPPGQQPFYREMVLRRIRIEVQSLAPLADKLHDQQQEAIIGLLERQGRLNSLLLLGLALMIGLSSGLMIRAITRSLSVLRQGIVALGQGDLAHHIDLRSDDELGEVANTLNQMRMQLSAVTVSRDTLEREWERFRTVADYTYDWEYWFAPDSTLLYMSPSCERITGYSREEFLADRDLLKRIIHPDDRELMERHFQETAIRESGAVDFRIVPRDGRIRRIAHVCLMVHGMDGRFLGRRVSNRDITERWELEQEARTIIQTALDGCWVSNDQGYILDVNDAYCHMSGYSRHELLNMRIAQVEVVESPEEVNRHVEQIQRDGHDRFETTHRRKDGTLLELEVSVRYLDVRGGVLVAFLHDITARKRDRRQLAETLEFNRRIIQEAPFGMVVFHQDGPTVLSNRAAVRILGAASVDDLLRQNFHQLASWRRSGMYDVAMNVLNSGQPGEHEVLLQTSFGVTVYLASLFVPLILNDQPHLLVMFHDVTQAHQAREAMARAKELAEEASRAKSDFLANMSHEIRTPMNAILGMADLLWESALTPRQRKYVQVSRSSGETLMGIINDILDFSKIEAGRMDLEEIDFNLKEEVETVCEIMAPRMHAKSLELVCRLAGDLPEPLRGDPIRLRQILLNFLGNALKFTERGEVELRVGRAAQESLENGIVLEFAVRDTGIGIPAHRLETIFESFVQGDRSTTRRYGGTGLGLAIVKRLAEQMGGRVGVESVVGSGSVFWVCLPFRFGVAADVAVAMPKWPGIRALVVDDTEANRMMLRETLEVAGMVVSEAGDGQTALLAMERAKEAQQPFDLMLLDVRMPVMDGFQVVACWKAAGYPGTPILMLTSDDREDDRKQCSALGIQHHLVKPARQAELFAILAEALGRAAVRQEEAQGAKPSAPQEKMSGLRILLAEDTVENALLIQAYFESTPHHLEIVENGGMALERLRGSAYDLVLMDVHMPEMDGYTATRLWRQWEQEQRRLPVPIYALTANAMQEDVQKSLDSGCNGHLTKPIRQKTLMETIARIREGQPPTSAL